MNIPRVIIAMILLISLTVYSNISAWSSPAEAAGTALLEIKAEVDGAPLVTTSANQVTLPASIIFMSNEPATIYYTTNGTDPTTATTTFSKVETADDGAAGPVITSADSILVTLGEDATGNLTSVQSYTFVGP